MASTRLVLAVALLATKIVEAQLKRGGVDFEIW